MSKPWEKYSNADSAEQPQASPLARIGNGQGALRQFAHGASFGFDDELAGAVSALTGGDYESAKDAYAAERDAWQGAHPKTSFALNLAGGVASGGGAVGALGKTAAGVKTAAKLANLPKWAQLATAGGAVGALGKTAAGVKTAAKLANLPKWAQLATAGGTAGALQGAGDAEGDLGDRAWGAAKGGALGAATGAILPPAVGALWNAGKNTVGRGVTAIVNALRTPEEQGIRAVARDLARDNISPEQFAQKLRDLGDNAVFADAGGKNVLALADAATTVPGVAKDAGLSMLDDRAANAGGRVMGSLTGHMGVPSTNVDGAIIGLHKNMRALGPEYEASLESAKVPLNEKLMILLRDEKVQEGIAAARKTIKTDSTISQLEGRGALDHLDRQLQGFTRTPDAVDPLTNMPIAGTGSATAVYSEAPSLRAWDYVRRGLDEVVANNTDEFGKMNNTGRQAYVLRTKLVGELDKAAPDYVVARNKYASEKEAEAAVKMGRAFLHEDSEVTARHIEDMGEAAQQYAKLGGARAVQDKIFNAPDTGMAYEQFMNRRENVNRLRALFGKDAEGFNGFMSDLKNEVTMGQTHRALKGNSISASRILKAKEIGSPIAGSDIPLTKEGLARRVMMSLVKPSDEVQGQLADILLTQDKQKQTAALLRLQQLPQSLNRPLMSDSQRRAMAYLLGKESASNH